MNMDTAERSKQTLLVWLTSFGDEDSENRGWYKFYDLFTPTVFQYQ